MICAPYAVAALCGDSNTFTAVADFRQAGFRDGAPLWMIEDVLRSRGLSTTLRITNHIPRWGVVIVAGPSGAHAVGIDDGVVYDIQDRTLPSWSEWLDRHAAKYPQIRGSVEIQKLREEARRKR